MITFHNLNPGPADGTNVLLAKILSRLGGLVQPGDHGNDLLARILSQLLSINGGGDIDLTGNLTVTGTTILNGPVTINTGFTVGLTGKIHVVDTEPLGDAAIWADSDHSVALLGQSTDLTGVRGNSTSGIGVWGASTGGIGVYGHGLSYGVSGATILGAGEGVLGTSTSTFGVHGVSTSSMGVFGESDSDSGVLGQSHTGWGMEGESDHSWGGVFTGEDAAGGGVWGHTHAGIAGNFDADTGVGIHAETASGAAAIRGKITGAATALLSLMNNAAEKLSVSILGLIKCIGIVPTPVILTPAGAAVTPDYTTGTHFRITLGDATTTINNPTNPSDGQRVVYELIQDGAGSRALALGAKFALGTDITAVSLTTTASKRDFLTTIYNSGADKHYVVAFVKGY